MKQFLLLFLLSPSLFFAQDYTLPDSAAIIKNHVKATRVFYYYDSTNQVLAGDFHYNTKGQCIYFSSGGSPYHDISEYYENGKLRSVTTKDTAGKTIYRSEYKTSGYKTKFFEYVADDMGTSDKIHYFDSLGNEIRCDFLYDGVAWQIILDDFNQDKIIIHRIDSFPMTLTCEYNKNNLIRQTFYDSLNRITENQELIYNEDGKIIQVNCVFVNKTDIYRTVYKDNKFKTTLNEKSMSKEAAEKWNREFSLLTESRDPYPRRASEDIFNITEFVHEITTDQNGNITHDLVSPAKPWLNGDLQPTEFSYTYEYW